MRKNLAIVAIPAFLSFACTSPHGANAYLAFGGGSMKHKTEGSGLDDKTSAGYFALGGEAMLTDKVGAGLRLEGSASDDDLFADLGAPLGIEARDSDLFLHGTAQLGQQETPLPLRFGLSFRNYQLEDSVGDGYSWASFGPRLEFSPDVQLAKNEDLRWSLPLRFGVGVGLTTIEQLETSEEWDTTMVHYDLGLATRVQFSKAFVELGYLLRNANYSESDISGSSYIFEADTTFSGIIFTVGAKF